jgi:hypothetical protein
VGDLHFDVAVFIVYANGRVDFIGMDSVKGGQVVGIMGHDVSRIGPTVGWLGLVLLSEVVVGDSSALRFLGS